jgi:hypothetical protein
MKANDVFSYDAHHSSTTKYYNILLILLIMIPVGYVFFLSLEVSLIFSLVLFSVMFVLIVAICFAVSRGGLWYELSPTEVRVNGLFNKKVPYTQITKVEKVQLMLLLKVFGGGLPGLYWGLFSTSIGNVSVYCTKRSGDYIMLTLANGQKLLLSPKEPDRFLDAITEQKIPVGTIQTSEIESEKRSLNKFVYAQVLVVTAAFCIFLGYFFIVYPALPQIVPVHFGFNGDVNRWAAKTELLWFAGLAAIFPVFNAVLALKFGRYSRSTVLLLGVAFTIVMAMFAFILYTIANWPLIVRL